MGNNHTPHSNWPLTTIHRLLYVSTSHRTSSMRSKSEWDLIVGVSVTMSEVWRAYERKRSHPALRGVGPRAPSVSNDGEKTACAFSLFIPFPSFFKLRSLSESPSFTSLCHLCIPLQTSLNRLFTKGSSEFDCLAWSHWPLTGDAVTTLLWAQNHFSPLMAI